MIGQRRFCIFISALLEGAVPSVRGEQGLPFLFETERDAQREIVDNAMLRMQEFLDGEREFEDAMTLEEYVVAVSVQEDGTITDLDGVVIT